MNSFSADYSSSPPSTPNAAGKQPLRNPLWAGISNPSTTPAGPPPSSAASFTPAGPPPSSTFGSSQIGSDVSKLQFVKNPKSASSGSGQLPPRTKNGTPAKPKNRILQGPNSSFANTRGPLGRTSAPTVEEEAEDEASSDESMERDWEEEDGDHTRHVPLKGFTGINSAYTQSTHQHPSSVRHFANQSSRRSQAQSAVKMARRPKSMTQLPRRGREDSIPGIAHDMVARAPTPAVTESDDIVLETEGVMRALHEELLEAQDDESLQATVSRHVHELIRIWGNQARNEANPGEGAKIGPASSSSPFEKANYLASLLLALHHPPMNDNVRSRTKSAASKSQALVSTSRADKMPLPQIILDWLDNYHPTYLALFHTVQSASPNSTSHTLFWDAVQSLMLRGKTREVSQLFAEADFKYAATAIDDGSDSPGYHGAQLQVVQSLVYRARQVLDGCPGTKFADWQTDNSDWDLYRKRVMTEVEHLMELADQRNGDEDDDEPFQIGHFAIRPTSGSLFGDSTLKSSGNIPTTIFRNLQIMYRILLGSSEEILAQSQDWLEATTSLTIWWDGTKEDEIEKWTMDVSQARQPSGLSSTSDPYLARLRSAFLCTTDPDSDDSFHVNTMSPTEVGIGLILQGDNGIVPFLQTFSLCISSAIAEVGSTAGWLTASSSPHDPGLDQEDLMVLSYGASNSDAKKDDFLYAYAEALFSHNELLPESGLPVEGWEVALSVASRFDDQTLTQETVSDFLEHLQLQDQDRVDRLVSLCYDLGLEKEARKVSEKFADHLVNNTARYGTALLCYARSHSSNKIRQVIDLLISYCLVQSKTYPTENDMDDDLRHLVEGPKVALSGLAEFDPDAAEILRFYLVGYACLRKFYNLRDEEVLAAKTGSKPISRPIARKRQAAKTLVAAISSAADSIYGGLYDAERQSALQVDGLLTLLGEATAFLTDNPDKRIYTPEQMYSLLAAIEDLQTINSRVYDAAEECLQASLRNFHGSLPPSPHAMLKKSISSGTNSNFSFSMMGSEMMARSGESAGGKSVGSMVMVGDSKSADGERGWDWRAHFKDKGSTGADVLRCLRFGIARELSMAELAG